MKEHVDYMHTGKKREYKKCTVCGGMFKDINAHMKILKSFPANRLKRHINKHSEDVQEVINCPQCDKKGTKFYIEEHKRTHQRVNCPTRNKELSRTGLNIFH